MGRRETQPGRAKVLLDAVRIPHTTDAQLEAVDVEPGEPLNDRFMWSGVREAVDEACGRETLDHFGMELARPRHTSQVM